MITKTAAAEIAGAFLTRAGTWTTPKARLYMNDISADTERPLADFTPPTFTGGADQALVEPTVADPIAGGVTLFPAGPLLFTCTVEPGIPETIYGFVLFDDDDDAVIGAHRFDEPIVIAEAGDHVYITPEFRISQ